MDFKEYPSYKDSGVEWLGKIPEHWEQKPIWSMFTRTKRTNHPNELLLSVYRDYGVIPKNSRNDNHNRASEDLTPYQLVLPNDLVINKMKAWQGSIAISEYKGIVSPAYYIYEPKQSYCSKYIHHLIRSVYFIQSYKNFSKGIRVNQWDLEHDAFTHINLLVPPLTEQNHIISFLDSETSRIDNLITKQEKLIETLEKHRKSVISHAVTKGLDSNVPMKDSGVEWLGEVPEHWKILQTRHLFNFGKGLTITKEDLSDEGIPCINYGEIHSKYGFEFNPLDNPLKCVSHDFIESNKNCLLNEGDFIFADTSEDLEGSGNFSYLNQTSTVFAGYHTIIARPKSGLNHRYLAYMFDSQAYRSQVRTEMKGVKVYSVSQGVLKSRLAWLPSIKEQVEIVKLLDEKSSKIDTLIAKQRELITKLKSYRTSIISHAVTGKIDVRDLVA
ncbi:restriction endonuclease subunit S [Acinetobacter gerneri]|uniref:Type I restriction modification DNA specificity domain-containing protein n=1 Tax=Acinetobacter gerneri DSM 14967 = CIP 107464 = MTCC 9824 TaxID=1120926 RepID=N8ZLB1_9GAMM|nr:restriction endonuclease subunit S [Acinetobacter gerneri]ENV32538.1 hypothetical protein F960_03296 [Acinetobacter gerneri DSM 14967 = CIP 107464 = MTCC 9824]EPR81074.1 Type I restriction-modification system, specificity subunit S [Acinetobacter gerneri DSM 14967 = CIP 107464 = MTCC 9824]